MGKTDWWLYILAVSTILLLVLSMVGCTPEQLKPNTISIGASRDQSWFTEGEHEYGLSVEATWQLK